jgi:hypothetical protein
MEWIPVLKKRPKLKTLVLCLGWFDTEGEVFPAYLKKLTKKQAAWFWEVDAQDVAVIEKWYWETGNGHKMAHGYRYERVTHWCPIPPIPANYEKDRFVV